MVHCERVKAGEGTLFVLCHDAASLMPLSRGLRAGVVAVVVEDWNAELSPWPAPPLYPAGEAFAGGADAVVEALQQAMDGPSAVCGYSLAGLCALVAAGRLPFSAVGSASGSLWYPGALDWFAAHPIDCPVVLSLGRREPKTRHPILSTILTCHEALMAQLEAQGTPCRFTLHDGGHSHETDRRMRHMLEALDALLAADR